MQLLDLQLSLFLVHKLHLELFSSNSYMPQNKP